jgi:hypothetical protein
MNRALDDVNDNDIKSFEYNHSITSDVKSIGKRCNIVDMLKGFPVNGDNDDVDDDKDGATVNTIEVDDDDDDNDIGGDNIEDGDDSSCRPRTME